jgi:hypothetical protein
MGAGDHFQDLGKDGMILKWIFKKSIKGREMEFSGSG